GGPSARTPRVPGFTGTHSSAFAPVSDIRDSTCTSLPRCCGWPCRIAPYATLCATGEFHVPRRSAPNEITKRERARSIVGSCSWPKLIALARRTTPSSIASNRIGPGAPNVVRNSETSAAPRARHQRQRFLIARGGQRIELAHQLADRFVPAHRLEVADAASAVALERLRHAIGVVGDLDRRLPARAQRALADRILREALEL